LLFAFGGFVSHGPESGSWFWFRKRHVPRLSSVILRCLPSLRNHMPDLIFCDFHVGCGNSGETWCASAPNVLARGIRLRIESLTQNYPAVAERIASHRMNSPEKLSGAAENSPGQILFTIRTLGSWSGGAAACVLGSFFVVLFLRLAKTPRRPRRGSGVSSLWPPYRYPRASRIDPGPDSCDN